VVFCGELCCSVLQCVAVCCNMMQCVAVCCSVLQCVSLLNTHTRVAAVAEGMREVRRKQRRRWCVKTTTLHSRCSFAATVDCNSPCTCVAVCCRVLQCVTVCCSALQCVAVRCSVLQCVAVCCSVLQCVLMFTACTTHIHESEKDISNTHMNESKRDKQKENKEKVHRI